MLDVGDGNRMHWETCGDPLGKPVVVLHEGPGSVVRMHELAARHRACSNSANSLED